MKTALLALLLLTASCSTLDGIYQRGPDQLDPVTGEARPGELVVNPLVLEGIRSVGTLPIPGAAIAAGLLGWLYTVAVAFRNRKIAVSLVQGIEAGRKVVLETEKGQELDEKIRQRLIEHQQFRGVLEYVAALVAKYTQETKRQ